MNMERRVITSYSIHYTKLYDGGSPTQLFRATGALDGAGTFVARGDGIAIELAGGGAFSGPISVEGASLTDSSGAIRGNVQCLDMLRALHKSPASLEVFTAELAAARGAHPLLDRAIVITSYSIHYTKLYESAAMPASTTAAPARMTTAPMP